MEKKLEPLSLKIEVDQEGRIISEFNGPERDVVAALAVVMFKEADMNKIFKAAVELSNSLNSIAAK